MKQAPGSIFYESQRPSTPKTQEREHERLTKHWGPSHSWRITLRSSKGDPTGVRPLSLVRSACFSSASTWLLCPSPVSGLVSVRVVDRHRRCKPRKQLMAVVPPP